MSLSDLSTPCLLLDSSRLARNVEFMTGRARQLGVALRPHLKTAKCVEVARLLHGGDTGPITVSTLREAEYFFAAGFTDIVYAVSIVPARLVRARALLEAGCTLRLLLDDLATAAAVAQAAQELNTEFELLVEIDCDGHRAGLPPESPQLVPLCQLLSSQTGTRFGGLLTHGGGAYDCAGPEQIRGHAELERSAVVNAADKLRAAGLRPAIVSVGSTPTCTFADQLEGVTDMRPGVFVFQDLYQVGLGVCEVTDVALSVLTTVISQRPDQGRLLIDAGSLALSKDHSTASQPQNCGYGLVCEADTGRLIPGLRVESTNQEHGMIVETVPGALDFSRFATGTRLRILPNHACMTAAAHAEYHIVDGRQQLANCWQRCNGW